jgi:hypothetical protein
MALIGDLFERDVTRSIPPVVYFHEQEPANVEREVGEYIITGGYEKRDARATEDGIHEQFVRLLKAIADEIRAGDAKNPACWISGYYGSGKSSFAKLLGLALDGLALPSGKRLADALLAQDHSPSAGELKAAWDALTGGIKPIAVVFDVGSKARDDEHIHAVAVRQVQERLGYSRTSNLVAEYELRLELEGLDDAFRDAVLAVHKRPWGELKDSQLAEDYFSAALHALKPELFPHENAWVDGRTGSKFETQRAAAEAVQAIQAMVAKRKPGHTLFLVVDEVSQYVHENTDRMLALQSFVEDLGARMKGKGWLLATGQQKLDEGLGVAASLAKMKDRFPPSLRVHLGIANIRDVVHKRLLKKKKVVVSDLEDLFDRHRADLALYAYKGEEVSKADFVEVYPMLPGHIPLLLDITTGLRSRSTRVQGDSHAIRGLLQLLGDLFREKGVAQREVGDLITIDMVYEVLHSALDPDVQLTIANALDHCAKEGDALAARVVKAVAMLELVPRSNHVTSAELVARCLYERLGQGNKLTAVQAALDTLAGHGFVGLSANAGYKIESSAGQEWQRERDAYEPTVEQRSVAIRRAASELVAEVEKVKLDGMEVPWVVFYSDSHQKDERLRTDPKYTVITADLQLTKGEGPEVWTARSDTEAFLNRFVWVAGVADDVTMAAKKVARSDRMVERYKNQETSLPEDRRRLLVEERNRHEAAMRELTSAVRAAFLDGQLYFRGGSVAPSVHGNTVKGVLESFGRWVAPKLYPNPTTYSVTEKDILYLIDNKELAAPPPVLGHEKLGILTLDGGRYEVTCDGRVPTDLLAYVKDQSGVTGTTLLAHFGAPPHGVAPDVVRAAVIGLLRGGKVRIEIPGVGEMTSVRDEGTRELLKDSGLRRAQITINEKIVLSARERNAICAFFKTHLNHDVARDNEAITDAVVAKFAGLRERLTEVAERFRRLPRGTTYPEALSRFEKALEACRRSRQVEPTVTAVKRELNALQDGVALLRRMEGDLQDATLQLLRQAEDVLMTQWPGLEAIGPTEEARHAADQVRGHLQSSQPWADAQALSAPLDLLRTEYRTRRRVILEHHALRVEQTIEELKRRDGFDRLDPDQRHAVLRHLREGGAATTDENAVAPPIETLEVQLAARLDAAKQKALAQLGAVLESLGEAPTVELSLDFSGREIKSEAELDRFLEELRRRILHELSSKHRVRLK